MHEIEKRVAATEATQSRFKGKPFDWSKAATCIHLFRYHATQMGHELPTVPRFRTALSAKRALRSMGCETLPEFLDGRFERIPISFMRVGDVAACPGTEGFEALYIKGDRHKFLGWHESVDECTIVDVDVTQLSGAWRL